MMITKGHCPTCSCAEDVPRAHSCHWCDINPNHPRCLENAAEEVCPHCGCAPEDVTLHRVDCPTVSTCAQTNPTLSEPWHPESEWYDRSKQSSWYGALCDHIAAEHS